MLKILSFGPQLYLASSREYSLLNLKHLEYTEHCNVGTFNLYSIGLRIMKSVSFDHCHVVGESAETVRSENLAF